MIWVDPTRIIVMQCLSGRTKHPRSWAEKAFPKLIHYNRLEKGGHFAAWEEPEVFAREI